MLSPEYYTHYGQIEQQLRERERFFGCEYCGYSVRPSSAGMKCTCCLKYKRKNRARALQNL